MSQDRGIAALTSSAGRFESNLNNDKWVRDMERYLSARRELTSRHRVINTALQITKYLWIR
jgi:hypothetical protein